MVYTQQAKRLNSNIKVVYVLLLMLSSIPVVSASSTISVFTTTPPTIDGQVTGNEWDNAAIIPLVHGSMLVKNDNSYLYLLVDLTGDTTNDPPPSTQSQWGDFFWLTFDVNIDKAITSNVDLNYGLYWGAYNLSKSYYLGPGEWTGIDSTTSQLGVGFGTSMNSATPHRIWEFAISRQEIQAQSPQSLVRIGLRTYSQNPSFDDTMPSNFWNDFSNLMEISFATTPNPTITRTSTGSQVAQADDWPMRGHDRERTGSTNDSVKPPLKLLWKFKTNGWVTTSSPAIVNDTVYIGSTDRNVYALDARTGALKWKFETQPAGEYGGVWSSPTVVNNTVYIGARDYYIYALDANNGTLKWKYQTAGMVESSPTLANGVLYITSSSSIDGIYALNAESGKLIWKYQASSVSSPTVKDGLLYVGSWDNNTYALDANTGELKWKFKTDDTVESSPTVADGIVYIGSRDSYVYALDAYKGKLIWKFQAIGYVWSSPAIANEVIYIASNSEFYSLNAKTGKLIWKNELGGIDSSAAIANGILYKTSGNGIYAIDAKNGEIRWSFSSTDHMDENSPAISNGVVYVGSRDGYVYAFAPGGDGSDVGETPISTPYQNAQTQESMKESGIVVLGKMVSWFEFAVFTLSMFIALGIGTTKLFKRKSLTGIFYKLGFGFAVFLWFWVVLSGKILSWFEFSVYTLFMIIALGIGTTKLFKRKSLTGIFYKLGFGFAVLFFLFAWLASHLSFLISSIVILTFGIVVLSLRRRESSPQHAPEQPSRAGSDILDAGYVLSKEASSLFNKKDYDGALRTYSEALDKFLMASNSARGDASLAKSIENNIVSSRKNILACKFALGISISEAAKSAFEEERCEDAERLYNKAVEHFEDALKDAEELDDADEINRVQTLISKTKGNINSCYISADKKKVEELSRRADILFKEATVNREKRELFKAREALKKASDTIDEAFTLATNRSFSDAQRTLGDLLRNIRNEMNAIDSEISGGVEQVKTRGEVSDITTDQPDIVHKTPFPQYLPKADKLLVLREYEFFNGFIRVKLSVNNKNEHTITDVALDLDIDDHILRLDHHEPDYVIRKGKIRLENISPNSDKTISMYLEPLTCSKEGMDINCRVDYKNAYGKPDSVRMEILKIPVVCPIFHTEQDINIGRLKELITSLPAHGSKVFLMYKGIAIEGVLALCREIIQMHDVRHVRTFKTADGKTFETWYYGKTKIKKIDLVIKASVSKETESIELFVAAPDQEALTGLLAELVRNLTKKGEALGKLAPQINLIIKDSIIQRSNLLDSCDFSGICGANIIIEDSLVQRSEIG